LIINYILEHVVLHHILCNFLNKLFVGSKIKENCRGTIQVVNAIELRNSSLEKLLVLWETQVYNFQDFADILIKHLKTGALIWTELDGFYETCQLNFFFIWHLLE
jgi:hypothetical protein